MARKVLTQYVDDLTGNEIPEGKGGPVTFSLDGHEYEIDLTVENADKMREAMGRYVSAARRLTRQASTSRRSGGGGGRGSADRERSRMIREWAVENGHMRPESRGRIPGAVVDMWENRNAGTQTSIATPAPAATPTPPVSATPEGGSKPQGETAKPAKAAAPKKETAKEPAHA